jgi:hypothetical protein
MPGPNDPPFVPPVVAEPTLDEDNAGSSASFQVLSSIPLPDSLANIPATAIGYIAWGQTLRRSRDHGLRATPIAAPAGTVLVEFHRVHAGAAILVVCGVAIRAGQEPDIPSPATLGDNYVLMYDHFEPFDAKPLPDGTTCAGLVWRYIFGLQAMPGPLDAISRGGTPLDNRPSPVFWINPAYFVATLLGPMPPVAGFSGGPINY